MNPFLLVAAAALLVLAGWILHKLWAHYAPSEKAVALKAATKALGALAALQSTTPEAIAKAAADQAHETALLEAFKDAASRLS